MKTSLFLTLSAMVIGICGIPATLSSVVFADAQTIQTYPALKMTPLERAPEAKPSKAPKKTASIAAPARVVIPAIGLDAPIQDVGINGKGEIDVPSGKTQNVGWYQYGTKPGDAGTAILDAHVFAALKNLHKVAIGDDVYIITKEGQTVHFVVGKKKTYPLASLTSSELFTGLDTHAMNIITCAGSLTRDRSTYDHRLIVYTTLVDD